MSTIWLEVFSNGLCDPRAGGCGPERNNSFIFNSSSRRIIITIIIIIIIIIIIDIIKMIMIIIIINIVFNFVNHSVCQLAQVAFCNLPFIARIAIVCYNIYE